MRLTKKQEEELITYQLSKSGEYFSNSISEYIDKNNLLTRQNAEYTKVRIRIKNRYGNIVFEKYYPLAIVKEKFLVDLITLSPRLSKKYEDGTFGIYYDIFFYKPDGSQNGGIIDFCINSSAWDMEFYRNNGLYQY